MRHRLSLPLALGSLLVSVPSYGAMIVSSAFDQVAAVNSVGGTVFQIGGAGPGTQLFAGGNFVAPHSGLTGVLVSMPGWNFISSTGPINDVGPTEPANISSLLTGVPTDMTYTQPAGGGPDGTIGDGSIQFSAGDSISAFWSFPQTGTPGAGADMFIATDTAGGGRADFIFRLGGIDVDSLLNFQIPGGPGGSGSGGVFINTTATFDEVFILGVFNSVEIDAIGVIPTPGAFALAAPAGVLLLRRRRRD